MVSHELVDPTGDISKHIDIVISNLESRKNEIATQRSTYTEIRSNIHLAKQDDQVMILVGDGYFVKYPINDAKNFLDRRIAHLDGALTDVSQRIQEAKNTLKKVHDFDTLTHNENDKYNEEGLPFMDIREELDDQGNVLNVKINDESVPNSSLQIHNKQEAQVSQVNESQVNESQVNESQVNESQVNESQVNESGNSPQNTSQLHSKASDSSTVEQQISHQPSRKTKSIDIDPKPIEQVSNSKVVITNPTETSTSGIVEIDTSTDASNPGSTENEGSSGTSNSGTTETETESITDLLQEMEIIQDPAATTSNQRNEEELLEKIDNLNISPDDKFRLKTILLDQLRQNANQSTSEQTQTDTPTVMVNPQTGVTIDHSDLIELEILADDFEDESNETKYADDEQWDFNFSDEDVDDEDEDDDESDNLLYGKTTFIANSASNARLWDEVNKLRNSASLSGSTQENSPITKSKKSVRFAEKLDIHEIENVSQELKNIKHFNQNVSIFIQNKNSSKMRKSLENSQDETGTMINESESKPRHETSAKLSRFKMIQQAKSQANCATNDSSIKTQNKPISDIVEREEPISDIVEREEPISDIVEREEPISDIVEREEPVSDIVEREEPVSDIVEREEPISDIVEREEPISDIVEREAPISDIVEREEPVSDIVEREAPISDIVEREAPISDIVEREEPVSDIVERETAPIPSITPTKETSSQTSNSSSKSKKISKFKHQKSQSPKVIELTKEKSNIVDPIDRRQMLADSISNIEDKIEIKEPSIDYASMNEDLDTMAKAYVLGMYDDDIETHGPVVDELADFEKVNELVEKHNNFINVKEEEEEEEEELEPEESSDDEVLLDIIENDTEVPDYDPKDNIILDQVAQEYYRLRRKLMQSREYGYRKTEEEMEHEPIDEDGNPIKVSRFRAARLANIK